ncbi:hypothetical protein ACFVDH_24475 [Streptomyces sp. NPDC057674]|uniref:hypothetical protein n=1 Tax=Streptomyces sp. NPDC057674 TaxID=3346203 RepID=UPI00369D8D1F
MKYFEDNPEIFAALVAVLAIVGSYLAGVRGAKIQAKGGRDQAAAAREAAEIAAKAQRVAALWSIQQVQIAEYIQRVRDARRLISRFYQEDCLNGEAEALARELMHALDQKLAEIELIASETVVTAATKVNDELQFALMIAIDTGQPYYVQMMVREQLRSPDPGDTATAQQAQEDVAELFAVARRVDLGEAGDAALDGAWRRARFSLGQISGVSEELITRVLPDLALSGWPREQDTGEFSVDRKTQALVAAARRMLRHEDDVAPTVPQQRRRWWRRAASVTPASDAAASV